MHIHKHQECKKEEKTENNIKQITKLNVYIEIKYLRINQQKDRMITT